MIDVDSFTDEEKCLQNYVGKSSARTYLEFYYDEKLADERQMRQVESFTITDVKRQKRITEEVIRYFFQICI